jgi:hypothetical protein
MIITVGKLSWRFTNRKLQQRIIVASWPKVTYWSCTVEKLPLKSYTTSKNYCKINITEKLKKNSLKKCKK